MQGSYRGFSSGVLELAFSGAPVLCISMRLLTGQLLLRAGDAIQGSAEIAAHIRTVGPVS